MDDNRIIELFLARDEAALGETVRKYGALCRKITLSILENEQDAEECDNDTYLALWNSIPPVRPKILSAYIAKIARNRALSRLKYMSAQRRQAVLIPADELSEVIGEPDRTSEDIAAAISEFLRQSSPEERRLFVRHYFSLETTESIAADEGCTNAKVKSVLFRMRKKLRIYLEKEGITL